jgi:pimeloyl-ACP methyl ester carboxylesterase
MNHRLIALLIVLVCPFLNAVALAASERELNFAGGEGVTLSATLTLPDDAAPSRKVPGVVLITGSGPQDRDETIFDKKPFAVLAAEFTARGYAVLRYDDRGVGRSTGDYGAATIDDFIVDAKAAVRELGAQPEVDPQRLFVLGHSEGAAAAAEIAAAGAASAGVIYLAGAALPGHAILTDQAVRLARAGGVSEDRLDALRDAHRSLMQAILDDAPSREIVDRAAALIAVQTDGSADDPRVKMMAGRVRQQLVSPWMKRFMAHDPAAAARRATVPALALFGTLDLQVAPEINAEPMEQALKASGHALSAVRVLEGKNHLFQNARTGLVQEYAMIESDLDPAVAQLIADWMDQVLRERAGTTAPASTPSAPGTNGK